MKTFWNNIWPCKEHAEYNSLSECILKGVCNVIKLIYFLVDYKAEIKRDAEPESIECQTQFS